MQERVNLKKPLSYDEQIDRLVNIHNLQIENRESAVEILSSVNYYRLSAYGIGLTQKDNHEKYVDGVSIITLYRLYAFDSKFKNAVFHVIEQIEIRLRTQLSYYLALEYGAEGYMEISNFKDKKLKDGSSAYSGIISSFKTECERQKNKPFVQHHNQKYNGHFPIWVAIELFSFGKLVSLYDIMQSKDKIKIAKMYATTPDYLKSWLLSLVEIRNICAHYGRLYNMPLKQSPALYKEYAEFGVCKIQKVFPAILVIKRMLKENEYWKAYLEELKKLMTEYDDVVNLSFMGFPKNWERVLSE